MKNEHFLSQPRPLFVYFRPFRNAMTNLVYSLKLYKISVLIVLGIRTWDSTSESFRLLGFSANPYFNLLLGTSIILSTN